MPDQIMTSKEDSFARYTVINRFPPILADLMANNSLSPEIKADLTELLHSLPSGNLTPLDISHPFAGRINQSLSEHPEYTWLNAPFLFIENYFYHKISDICGYFSNGFDYFFTKKKLNSSKG